MAKNRPSMGPNQRQPNAATIEMFTNWFGDQLLVCLRKLEDTENAFKAFQRSSEIQQQQQMDAGRNPLVYLNFALFCYETGRVALATEQFARFVSSSQDLLLPTEVSLRQLQKAQWAYAVRNWRWRCNFLRLLLQLQ